MEEEAAEDKSWPISAKSVASLLCKVQVTHAIDGKTRMAHAVDLSGLASGDPKWWSAACGFPLPRGEAWLLEGNGCRTEVFEAGVCSSLDEGRRGCGEHRRRAGHEQGGCRRGRRARAQSTILTTPRLALRMVTSSKRAVRLQVWQVIRGSLLASSKELNWRSTMMVVLGAGPGEESA